MHLIEIRFLLEPVLLRLNLFMNGGVLQTGDSASANERKASEVLVVDAWQQLKDRASGSWASGARASGLRGRLRLRDFPSASEASALAFKQFQGGYMKLYRGASKHPLTEEYYIHILSGSLKIQLRCLGESVTVTPKPSALHPKP